MGHYKISENKSKQYILHYLIEIPIQQLINSAWGTCPLYYNNNNNLLVQNSKILQEFSFLKLNCNEHQ
jgi:hypothetical protein